MKLLSQCLFKARCVEIPLMQQIHALLMVLVDRLLLSRFPFRRLLRQQPADSFELLSLRLVPGTGTIVSDTWGRCSGLRRLSEAYRGSYTVPGTHSIRAPVATLRLSLARCASLGPGAPLQRRSSRDRPHAMRSGGNRVLSPTTHPAVRHQQFRVTPQRASCIAAHPSARCPHFCVW